MMEREYINFLTAELSAMAEVRRNDIRFLQDLCYELSFRTRNKAALLRVKILQYLSELEADSFNWPSTIAPEGWNHLQFIDAEEKGLLSFLGYKVGIEGLPEANRREILCFIYENELSSTVRKSEYIESWGGSHTGNRLLKLANCLAAFTRNAKKRSNRQLQTAIEHWESDLLFLKEEYYVGVYDNNIKGSFPWPSTEPTK